MNIEIYDFFKWITIITIWILMIPIYKNLIISHEKPKKIMARDIYNQYRIKEFTDDNDYCEPRYKGQTFGVHIAFEDYREFLYFMKHYKSDNIPFITQDGVGWELHTRE